MTVGKCPKCGGGVEFDGASDPILHWHNGKIHCRITVRLRCFSCGKFTKYGYVDSPLIYPTKSEIPATTEAFQL